MPGLSFLLIFSILMCYEKDQKLKEFKSLPPSSMASPPPSDPSGSPTKIEVFHDFFLPLGVISVFLGFIPIIASGLAGLYMDTDEKEYVLEGLPLTNLGRTSFYEARIREAYCGIERPVISKENPYYLASLTGQLRKQKKSFCFTFLLPTLFVRKNGFIENSALKLDPEFINKNSFEKEFLLQEVYGDFVFYNTAMLNLLAGFSQLSYFFILGPYIRLVSLEILRKSFQIRAVLVTELAVLLTLLIVVRISFRTTFFVCGFCFRSFFQFLVLILTFSYNKSRKMKLHFSAVTKKLASNKTKSNLLLIDKES